MIFYTNFSIPERFAAVTRGPFAFIRPEYRDDIGLREHERTHVRQWLRSLGLHPFFYLFSHDYRLSCEVEAYKVQLQYCTDVELNTRRFARFIATKYDLSITDEEAYRLLS